MPPLATVVIVAWNGADLIDECLDAVATQELPDSFVVSVIDNASTSISTATSDAAWLALSVLPSAATSDALASPSTSERKASEPSIDACSRAS